MNAPKQSSSHEHPTALKSGSPGQHRAVVTGVAQKPPHAVKRPAAPSVYRPHPTPKVLQTKTATNLNSQTAQLKAVPKAPPVYRPQPVPKVLQAKRPDAPRPAASSPRRTPTAPPVYRPQSTPKCLQLKTAGQRPTGQPGHRAPTPPPVYRPQPAPKVLQLKTAAGQPHASGHTRPLPGAHAAQRTRRPAPAARSVIQRSPMRGDPSPVSAEPGATAPTIPQLLVGRFVALAMDSGVKPEDITERAVTLFKAAVPYAKRPHPLHAYTVAEYVVRAIYKHETWAARLNVKAFKSHLVKAVRIKLANNDRGKEVDNFQIGQLVDAALDQYIAQAEAEIYSHRVKMKNKELRRLMRDAVGNNPNHRDLLEVAAERYLAANARPQLQEPTQQQKHELSKALERLPSVKAMYEGEIDKLPDGGGLHLQSLNVLPQAQAQSHFEDYMVGFGEKVTRGMATFAGLVEGPRRPPKARVSNIEINPDTEEVTGMFFKSTKVIPFRPDASRERNKVRLSIMSEAKDVVHELGHQVEYHLPAAEWLDLQHILTMRHKGGKLLDIYDNREEAAFNATMPAFEHEYGKRGGMYGAKVYEDGNTEMVSMTMEFFSEPGLAESMITRDPLVAATVLRAIRPEEFNRHVPHSLQDLLPRGSGALNADAIDMEALFT
jgi:hypothetical protein